MHSPITLPCGLTLPNRVALAPLTNLQSQPDGCLGEDELLWLRRRAAGGFGLLSTCAAFVSKQGHAWPGQLGIAEPKHLAGLSRLAQALAPYGPAIVQLHHGGVKAMMAPDPISTGGPKGGRAATQEDLDQVVADYVAAARMAEQAGFDGVEIHGANGYLFTQFLAPKDNPRTDAYGGALAGRAKLLRDTLQAVRAAVAPSFAVGVRLSPVDTWARRGLVLSDSERLVQWLAKDGADFVHLSLQNAGGPAPFDDSEEPVVARIRAALPAAVALISAGGIWSHADAQAVLNAGADLVALGRVAIANPDWPILGADDEIVRSPFTPEHLRSVAVGEAFVTYLKRFPGLLVGGAAVHTQ